MGNPNNRKAETNLRNTRKREDKNVEVLTLTSVCFSSWAAFTNEKSAVTNPKVTDLHQTPRFSGFQDVPVLISLHAKAAWPVVSPCQHSQRGARMIRRVKGLYSCTKPLSRNDKEHTQLSGVPHLRCKRDMGQKDHCKVQKVSSFGLLASWM